MKRSIARIVAALGIALALASLFLQWGRLAEGTLEYGATGLTQGATSCDWFIGHGQKTLCEGSTNLAARAGLVLCAPLIVGGALAGAWGALRVSRVKLLGGAIAVLAGAFLLRATITNAMIATAQRSVTTDLAGIYVAVIAGAALGVAGAMSHASGET